MPLRPMPREAAWRHLSARDGFEVLFTASDATGHTLRGHTTAVEDGRAWSVGYVVETDEHWRTRRLDVRLRGAAGDRAVTIEPSADGRWFVDGAYEPMLDGCIDVDLESSAVTNTLPVHRIGFVRGVAVDVPAVFVRADDLQVERVEQTYELSTTDESGDIEFAYTSATFDFACTLRFDASGLVVDYPGIATRYA